MYRGYRYITLLLETSRDIVNDVEALLLETSRDVMAGGARDLETLRDDADETAPGGLLPRETSREGNDSVDLASRGSTVLSSSALAVVSQPSTEMVWHVLQPTI